MSLTWAALRLLKRNILLEAETKSKSKHNSDKWLLGNFGAADALVLLQLGICHVAENLIKQLKPQSADVFVEPVFVSLGWGVSMLQHQPLYGKHNTETNHSQVSGHWSSVISDELMAPLNDQQGSQGNISMYLYYWSSFCVKNLSRGCWKAQRLN